MHKKLIAIATALCCVATMGASMSSAYAAGEKSISFVESNNIDFSEMHTINMKLVGNLTSSQMLHMTFNLYDHFGTLRGSYTGPELEDGVTLSVPHHQVIGENGDVWYVEAIDAFNDKNVIMTSAIGTNKKRTAIYMTHMDNDIQHIEMWDSNKVTVPSVPSQSYRLSTDRNLSIREIGSLKFNVYDSFNYVIDSFTGADILAGVSFNCNGYNKGFGRIECIDTEIIKQNGWYIPPVEFDLDTNSDVNSIEISTETSVPDDAEYEIPFKLSSFGMTDEQLADTVFTVYDNSGNVKNLFSGKELMSDTIPAALKISKTEIAHTGPNAAVWLVKGEYMGESILNDEISIPNVSFYANKTDTVELSCGLKSEFVGSPAVAKVPLEFYKTSSTITDENLRWVEYTVTDAFDKEVGKWSGDDIIDGNAYITWDSSLKGYWKFTPKVLSADKSIQFASLTIPVDELSLEKNIELTVQRDRGTVQPESYGFVCTNKPLSDYIENVMDRYDITARLVTSDDTTLMTLTPDLLKSGRLSVMIPKSSFVGLSNRIFTLVPDNVPRFLADIIKPIKIDLTDIYDSSVVYSANIPWFDYDENFYREIAVNTINETTVLVYANTKDKNNKNYCAKNECKMMNGSSFETTLSSCKIKVPVGTDVWFHDMTTHAIINVDTTKDEALDANSDSDLISFIRSDGYYECYISVDGRETCVDRGTSFLEKVCSNRWLEEVPVPTYYSGLITVKLTDNKGNSHMYYWKPTYDKGEPGLFIDKEYSDNYKWYDITRRKLDYFLVNKQSGKDAMEQTPTNQLLWDRNHDGKLNVFDSVISKREYIKQSGK